MQFCFTLNRSSQIRLGWFGCRLLTISFAASFRYNTNFAPHLKTLYNQLAPLLISRFRLLQTEKYQNKGSNGEASKADVLFADSDEGDKYVDENRKDPSHGLTCIFKRNI